MARYFKARMQCICFQDIFSVFQNKIHHAETEKFSEVKLSKTHLAVM